MRKLEISFRSSRDCSISGKSLRSLIQAAVVGVALLSCSAAATATTQQQAAQRHLMPTVYPDFEDYLRRLLERIGGPDDDRSLEDAPMGKAQLIYEQLGGDPEALQFTKETVDTQWFEFKYIFQMLGGSPDGESFKPFADDIALALLWDYCVERGGKLRSE